MCPDPAPPSWQARHNQDALTQLIAVEQAVPVLAGIIGSDAEGAPAAAAAEPVVRLAAVRLLGALASTHTDGRLQVRRETLS